MTESLENNDFKIQIQNDSAKLMCKNYNACLGLTCVIYDGNIRIPCEIVEAYGLVEAVKMKVIYLPWFGCRMFMKGLKIIIFPKQFKKFIKEFISK
nr:MAG TPA: hypothetical protein [Caudoviricetes sp.]